MEDLAHTVGKLQAAEDIRHLKARYARVCDTGYKPEGMAPLFTKDAVWDGGRFGRYEGIDAICGFFDGVSADIVWALHYMIAPVIEVERRPRHRERHLVPLAALHGGRARTGPRRSGSRAATPTATARRTAPGSSPRCCSTCRPSRPWKRAGCGDRSGTTDGAAHRSVRAAGARPRLGLRALGRRGRRAAGRRRGRLLGARHARRAGARAACARRGRARGRRAPAPRGGSAQRDRAPLPRACGGLRGHPLGPARSR